MSLFMKRAILLLSVVFCLQLSGQVPERSISISFQPQDIGIGAKFEEVINQEYGFYGSIAYGNYRLPFNSRINDHYKFAFGVLMVNRDKNASISVGMTHHLYGRFINVSSKVKNLVNNPISFEAGATAYFRNMALGIRMDILKWEGCVDFRIPLNF